MSIEGRLVEALHDADHVRPSPDLFARLERSIEEDRAYRRRRILVALAILGGLAAIAAWIAVSVERDLALRPAMDTWKMVVAFLAVASGVIVGLAPHIRRFARSFVSDVFHLTPETGDRFLAVMDIAYYIFFTGLVLVDADSWRLGETHPLDQLLADYTSRLASLLLVMGVLHAVNIAILPVLGIVYNSIARRDLRARAGDAAPPETMRARTVDRHARSFAVAVVVIVLAVLFSLVLSGPGGLVLVSLG